MGKAYLLGVKKFTSKKGTGCEVMVLRSEFSERMYNEGCFGLNAEEHFVPDALKGTLTKEDVGKEVVLDFEISNGRAFLTGFRVVGGKPAEDAAKR